MGKDTHLPLSRISLQNFKSVRQAEVDLANLTVIVGKNSAGKSTLIQSLLAVSQAARAEHRPGLISLNGQLVRLGSYREFKNLRASSTDPVTISICTRVAWTLELAQLVGQSFEDAMNAIDAPTGVDVEVTAELVPFRNDSNESRAELSRLWSRAVPIADQGSGRQPLVELEAQTSWNADENSDLDFWQPDYLALRDYEYTREGKRAQTLPGLRLDGFLPRSAVIEQRLVDALLTSWWELYELVLSGEIRDERSLLAQSEELDESSRRPTNRAVTQAVSDLLRAVDTLGPERKPDEYSRLFTVPEKGTRRQAIAKSIVTLGFAEFVNRTVAALPDESDGDQGLAVRELLAKVPAAPDPSGWHVLAQGHAQLRDVAQDLKYLGPIRKPDWDPGPSIFNIGTAGEFAPTVLRARGADVVNVPVPPSRAGGGEIWAANETTVAQAVNDTLQFLELAGEANVKDHGRFGVGFTIRSGTLDEDVDLTAVGVGVSQALPIVLLLVLSEPNEVVVVEQPELHLHPAMQLRMADLLLQYANARRQVIVETHSEHIVNRLRRRVVENPTDFQGVVQLQFAESDEVGDTRYRGSTISADGTLSEDWPEGFFEVGSGEATEFLRALLSSQQVADQ